MKIEPVEVIAQAREWLGVKYLHQGRTRTGADCLGFIAEMMNELGSTVFIDYLPHNYARNPQAILLEGLEALTRTIELQPGALIAFQFPQGKYPSHAGIYTGESVIHCYERVGKVVEHGYRAQWLKMTAGVYALPLVVYE